MIQEESRGINFLPAISFEAEWPDVKEYLFTLTSPIEVERKYRALEYYYQIVERICLNENGDQLLEQFESFFKDFIEQEVQAINLESCERTFQEFHTFMNKLNNIHLNVNQIFSYFEYCVVRNLKRISLRQLLMQYTTEALIIRQQLLQNVATHFMKEVEKLCFSQQNTNIVLDEVVRFFKDLKLYGQGWEFFSFQNFYLESSRLIFKNFYTQFKSFQNIKTYLNLSFDLYQFQIKLAERFLSSELLFSLIKIFNQEILIPEKNIYSSDVLFFESDDSQSLNQLYWYFRALKEENDLKKLLFNYTQGKCEKITGGELGTQTIQDLIEFNLKVQQIVKNNFSNDVNYRESVNSAFEGVIYNKVNTLSELFSKYIDMKLVKTTASILNEDLIVRDIDNAFLIFKYFTAKDIFETFFTQRLTRRILLDLSYSYELEFKVFNQLKFECGDQYTRKAEDIMKDIQLQKQITDEFISSLETPPQMELNMTVVSSNAWTLSTAKMPMSMEPFGSIQKQFEEFYFKKNDKIKLEWQTECSNCYVEANFREQGKQQYNSYRFQVSVVQAMILLMFNCREEISAEEIFQALPDISQSEVAGSLIAICTMKEQEVLLKKNTETRSIKKDDRFTVNPRFKNKKKIIRINQLQRRETKENVEEITNKVLHERVYMIDASIVKIMKRVRTLRLNNLIQEVLDDLKLPIQARLIKTQIEQLINREYLVRDSEDMFLFHYLA